MKPFLDRVGIDPEIGPEELADHELMRTPHIAAMFANTISLTLLRAGEKVNVIPSHAEAALDCRLLPGVTADGFLQELREVIADERVRISSSNSFHPTTSPVDTELFKALEESLTEHYPEVPVLPTISVGFTDSRCFRKLGTHCYGVLPFLSDAEVLTTIHGHDERIPLESLGRGTRVLFGVIERLNA
jgi:acetylornithine deacetylase/succinyl-diaminopimelate desuccinylase-like protein